MTMRWLASGEPLAAIASAAGVVRGARGEQSLESALPSNGRPDSADPTAAAGDQRAEVADRVTPALVQLAGLDDDVGAALRPGDRPADRDDRGPCAGRPCGAQRGIRGARPALVADRR